MSISNQQQKQSQEESTRAMPRTRTVIYEITASIKKTNTQTADAFNGTHTNIEKGYRPGLTMTSLRNSFNAGHEAK